MDNEYLIDPLGNQDSFESKSELLTFSSHEMETNSEPTLNEEFELPDPFLIERDTEWHNELVAYIGKLSIEREKYCKPIYIKDLVPALVASSEIVNKLVMFISEKVEWASHDFCMPEVLERAGKYIASLQNLSEKKSRTWFGLRASKSPTISVDEAAVLFYEFAAVLEQCFSALGNRFQTMEFKLSWVKSCGIFLAEVQNDLKWTESFKPE